MNRVITASRELGSGGPELAKRLAELLGLPIMITKSSAGSHRKAGWPWNM